MATRKRSNTKQINPYQSESQTRSEIALSFLQASGVSPEELRKSYEKGERSARRTRQGVEFLHACGAPRAELREEYKTGRAGGKRVTLLGHERGGKGE
jgi:hypothetical protein